MGLFLQVSSSLAPIQYTGVCCIAQLPNRGWLLGFGREVFFPRHKCSLERTEYLMGLSCLIISIYMYYYCVIQLYTYISILLLHCLSIVFFVYSSIACLQHGGITFFISIFYFCSLLRPLFFMIVVPVSLSFGFLRCKGMAVLSDTKHQAMPYSAKTFPECLPQMLHIWVFQKTFYRIVWCSDSWNHHFLMHVKRLYDDEMTE